MNSRRMRSLVAIWLSVGLMATAAASSVAEYNLNPQLTRNPKCDVPFPHEALRKAPPGFKGETLALITFNAKGEFRSANLLRSSGNEELDDAALRAAVGARCEPLADLRDRSLDNALIGIPFSFTFDNSHTQPAEPMPVR